MLKPKYLKIALCFIILFSLFGFYTPGTKARTVDDIQKEIDSKQAELEKAKSDLSSAQTNLDNSTAKKESAHGKLSELEAEIQQINDQLTYNKLKVDVLEENKALKELEKEQREVEQDKQITASYLSWKSAENEFTSVMFGSDNPVKTTTYYNLITGNEQASIESLAKELNTIEEEYNQSLKEAEDLQTQSTQLEEERKAKEAEINQINDNIAAESSRLAVAQSQTKQTQSQIDQLYAEQKALRDYETWLLGQSGNGGSNPIVGGEFYFTGRGRDNVQGHGIGMSQSGALGAALAGWNYKQILEFYFPSTTIITYTARTTVPVQGYGEMNLETYVSGLGEVASYGCENLGINFGDRGYWGCWPNEAIKAQVVVARNYALNYTSNGSAICTTAACQVYAGGEAKRWAADATSTEVVAFNGTPIKAYYAAQNNQGAGTANNDTVWSSREGNGTPVAYLRSVNDNSFYFPSAFSGCGGGDCAKWGYRTNSYTMSEMQGMLEWSITSPSTSITTGDRTFLTSVLSDIGKLSSITFERDPSQRVAKVVVTGDKGSRKMAGWFFKSLWNIWVGNVQPSGQTDYIYSLTFYLMQG